MDWQTVKEFGPTVYVAVFSIWVIGRIAWKVIDRLLDERKDAKAAESEEAAKATKALILIEERLTIVVRLNEKILDRLETRP